MNPIMICKIVYFDLDIRAEYCYNALDYHINFKSNIFNVKLSSRDWFCTTWPKNR